MPKYNIIYIDPPWQYTDNHTAKLPYPSITKDVLKTFPLDKIMAKRCLVLCWITCPHAYGSQAEITKAWCDRYKLTYKGLPYIWVKTTKDGVPLKATGVRPNTTKPLVEFVAAFGTTKNGRTLPICTEAQVQTVFAPRRGHSVKPFEVRNRIDELFGPDPKKIELFARKSVDGWDSWGNQAQGEHVLPADFTQWT